MGTFQKSVLNKHFDNLSKTHLVFFLQKSSYKAFALFLFSFLLFFGQVQAQVETDIEIERLIGEAIENISEESDEVDVTEIADRLYRILDNPINLNTADFTELREIPFLTDQQAYNIITYREKYGDLLSPYELKAVDGMNRNLIQKILPFILIEKEAKSRKFSLKKAILSGRKDVFLRYGRTLQHQDGFRPLSDSSILEHPNQTFLGDPNKLYVRFSSQYHSNFQYGFTLEKDKGEVFLPSSLPDSVQQLVKGKAQTAFDYRNFHLFIKDIKNIKALAIGDYHLQFGQGLLLWTSPSFGKAWNPINIKRFSKGIKAYRSTNENLFLRGIAGNFQLNKKIQLAVFYSSKLVDANQVSIADTTIDEETTVSSFQQTGLHRTLSELIDKQSIRLRLMGSHLRFQHKTLEVGMTIMETRILGNYIPTKADYLTNFPDTNSFTHYSFDFSYLFHKTVFFGEIAGQGISSVPAQLYGMTSYLHPRISISVLYRNYPVDYFPGFYASPFGEKSDTYNEKGFYAGTQILLQKNWTLTAYVDNFSFPYIRYRTDAPSYGYDYRMQLDYSPSRYLRMYFRYKGKMNQTNQNTVPEIITSLEEKNKSSFRYNITYSINRKISFANRIEVVTVKQGEDYHGSGYLIFQDVKWRPRKIPLSLSFRFTIFDTDTYEERIYAYEQDVLYAFSVPAHYYKGTRVNLAIRYKITPKIHFWFKVGHTTFSNRNTISSGTSEIIGNQKTDVRMQLRWKF